MMWMRLLQHSARVMPCVLVMVRPRLIRNAVYLLALLSFSQTVFFAGHSFIAEAASPSLSLARDQFAQGDIVAARDNLRKTAAKMSRSDREEAYKLLGIAAYLTGQRDEARQAFEEAVRLNPRTQLDKRDVLDPSISQFFEAVRDNTASSSRSSPSSSKPKSSSSSASGQSKPRAQAAPPGGLPPVRAGASALFVQSNAAGSSVFANGLFVGTAGQVIELPPGEYKVTVSAPQFEASTQTVKLAQGQQLVLQFQLEDPVERRKRELLAERERRRLAEAAAAAERARELERRRQAELAAAAERARELERRRQLAAQELARQKQEREAQIARLRAEAELRRLEREAEAERARELEAARRAEEERKRNEVLALKAKALAAERELQKELAALQRGSAQQEAPPPARPARPRDGLGAPSGQTRRTDPQRSGSDDLGYRDELPRGQRSLADEFRQDGQQARDPRLDRPDARNRQGNRQAYQAPAAKSPAVAPVQRRRSDKSAFLAVLPFGVGQFQNESYLLGTASALLQVGSLGWGIYSYTLYTSAQESFKRESASASGGLEQSYIDETNRYLSQWKTNSVIGFVGFGAIWALSGIEALMSINSKSARVGWNPAPEQGVAGADAEVLAQQSAAEPTGTAWTWAPLARADGSGFGLQVRVEW